MLLKSPPTCLILSLTRIISFTHPPLYFTIATPPMNTFACLVVCVIHFYPLPPYTNLLTAPSHAYLLDILPTIVGTSVSIYTPIKSFYLVTFTSKKPSFLSSLNPPSPPTHMTSLVPPYTHSYGTTSVIPLRHTRLNQSHLAQRPLHPAHINSLLLIRPKTTPSPAHTNSHLHPLAKPSPPQHLHPRLIPPTPKPPLLFRPKTTPSPLSLLCPKSPHSHPPTSSPPPPPTQQPIRTMRTRAMDDITKPKQLFNLNSTTLVPLPKTPQAALSTLEWFNAMHNEFSALIKNETWELVPRQPDMHIIRSMWLFKHKFRSDGSLERYKARLVCDGRGQQVGIDCGETFSQVVKPATIRLILSLALSQLWPIHQLDVTNAFIHGNLDETVICINPWGSDIAITPTTFVVSRNPCMV
ncbi:putative RNA-directed DNA polymerase [Helianthus annuus]|nr:putative RNA-directed DNA polymerase [Helianthus annuus]